MDTSEAQPSTELAGSQIRTVLGSPGILRPESIATLERVTKQINLTAGSPILTQGDLTNELYIIDSGQVSVFHADPNEKEEKHIARLGAGQLVGEIALIDGGPRSLSARAETDCALTEICPNRIQDLPEGERLLAELKGALSHCVVNRLRSQNNQFIASLKREIEAAKIREQFGQFFIFMLAILCSGAILSNAFSESMLDIDVHSPVVFWMYTLVLLVPSLLVIWKIRIPISQLGVTTKGLRKSVIEGLIASACAIALAVVAVIALRGVETLVRQVGQIELLGVMIYLIHSFGQEMVGRGVIQTSFQKFMSDGRGYKAVILTAVIFGTMHIHFGITAVVATFVGSILFGLFYLRHYNLAGVTLLHFTAGVAVFTTGFM